MGGDCEANLFLWKRCQGTYGANLFVVWRGGGGAETNLIVLRGAGELRSKSVHVRQGEGFCEAGLFVCRWSVGIAITARMTICPTGGWGVVPGLQAFTPHLSRGNPVHFAPFDPSPCTDSPPFTTPLHPSPQIQPGPPRISLGFLCMSN